MTGTSTGRVLDPKTREALRGLTMRRLLAPGKKKHRVQKTVQINREFIEALGDVDLNFEVNLALELRLTEHSDLKLQLVDSGGS